MNENIHLSFYQEENKKKMRYIYLSKARSVVVRNRTNLMQSALNRVKKTSGSG